MKKLLILTLFGALFVPMNGSAKAADEFICQSEVSTGFYKRNGTWKSENFKLKAFYLKVINDFEAITSVERIPFECQVPYPLSQPNQVVCGDKSGLQFLYDKSSKRFLYSAIHTATYIDADEHEPPIIYAGTCEKF